MGQGNLLTIFLTGLITGGLTCMAVQGGLLAASIAQREQERLSNRLKTSGHALPILSFLAAKLLTYTALGAILGYVGSLFILSIKLQVALQLGVAVFMIGTALNILGVHPIFRYFIIQPPHFFLRFVRKQSKSKEVFGPAFLGAFTVFIPCGTTQAMMALAIASGSPWIGAAILFAFVLGTSPVFFILGYFATKLGSVFEQRFMKVAAFAILFLALFNLNNAIALTGSRYTLDSIWSSIWCTVSFCQVPYSTVFQPVDEETITINSSGYAPNVFAVKAGSSVKLHLVNTSGGGCTQSFTIPSLGIQKVVPLGSSGDLSFTAPVQKGPLSFMCSMGMYRGQIQVI